MRHVPKRLSWFLAVVILLCGVFSIPVLAATNSKSGLTLTPPFQEINLLPNQAEVKGSFSISNNNAEPVSFDLTTVDMGTLDETGGVVFSGISADYQKKYGLAEWLHLPNTSLTIQPKSSQTVDFTVVNSPDMQSGGHYGAVVVKALGQAGQNKNQVNLSPQAATLIFARKIGGEVFGLSLQKPPSKTYYRSLPSELNLSFKNTGNVHVVPRGVVLVKNPKGHVVAKGVINSESSLILPERNRLYSVKLTKQKQILWPGKYKVEVSYRYDGKDNFATESYSILLLNLPLGLVMLLIFGVLAWLGFLLAKRFHRWFRRKRPKPEKAPKPAPQKTFMSVRRIDDVVKRQKSSKK